MSSVVAYLTAAGSYSPYTSLPHLLPLPYLVSTMTLILIIITRLADGGWQTEMGCMQENLEATLHIIEPQLRLLSISLEVIN